MESDLNSDLMKYSGAAVRKMQLDQFVTVVANIYSAQDQKRSLWDVWCHTIHHAAAIGEEVRKDPAGDRLLIEAADCSLWLFTVVQRLYGQMGETKSQIESPQESLVRIQNTCSDLLWNKYPGMCPVCFWRRNGKSKERDMAFLNPCDCLLYENERLDQNEKRLRATALRAFSDNNRSLKPTGVDKWQEMFAKIFKANLHQLTLTDIAFHLFEEIGEVSDAMTRMYTYTVKTFVPGELYWRQVRLEEQLADVFSRLFTFVEKLDLVRETTHKYDQQQLRATSAKRKPVRLSEIIWSRYGSERPGYFYCPHCKKPLCECPIVLVPPDRSIAELLQNASEDIPEKGD